MAHVPSTAALTSAAYRSATTENRVLARTGSNALATVNQRRRARRRAARWRQGGAERWATMSMQQGGGEVSADRRPVFGCKRRACEIAIDDVGDAAFDQGFTIGALSMTRDEFMAVVPAERRMVATVTASGVRVAFDIVEVYRWWRTNPDGGLCGPFGQLPVDQAQRDAVIARAERLLPKRQRVTQETRFDYAWHDQGDDLHYHEPPSGAYLRERVAAGDHEGILYCLDALAPGDITSCDEARRLLVRVANASLTTSFEHMVAHEQIGGRLGVDGLSTLIDDIVDMPTPRIDLLVPACRAAARLARDATERCESHAPSSRSPGRDETSRVDPIVADLGAGDSALTLVCDDTIDCHHHGHDQRAAAPLSVLARTIRRIYRVMCLRTAHHPVIGHDDDSDSDSDDDDEPPIEAGCISKPLYSAAVRAVFEATGVKPDVACLVTAMDARARDLLDYMLAVARPCAQDAIALALHGISIGCAHALRLVLHHCRGALDDAAMHTIARAAAASPPPMDDLLGVIAAVAIRLARGRHAKDATPTCPRRMRFEDD